MDLVERVRETTGKLTWNDVARVMSASELKAPLPQYYSRLDPHWRSRTGA